MWWWLQDRQAPALAGLTSPSWSRCLTGTGTFVSVTQSFNTTTSMGRLTLNILLSFAQFEREVTAERIRDKVAASRKKGMWMGGVPPYGYRVENRKLVVDEEAAAHVRWIFARSLRSGPARNWRERSARAHPHPARQTGSTRNTSTGCSVTAPTSARRSTRVTAIPAKHDAMIDREVWTRFIRSCRRARASAPPGPPLRNARATEGAAVRARCRRRSHRHILGRATKLYPLLCQPDRPEAWRWDPCPIGRVSAGEIEAAVM